MKNASHPRSPVCKSAALLRHFALASLLIVCLLPGRARAADDCGEPTDAAKELASSQPSASAVEEADQLFERGREKIAAGDAAAACQFFAQAQALRPGTGTLLNLGHCQETQGQYAEAWRSFRLAASVARLSDQSEKEAFACERAQKLEDRIGQLRISVSQPGDGLQVSIDGRQLTPGALNDPQTLTRGKHQIQATQPGREAWSTEVDVAATEVGVTIPALSAARNEPIAAEAAETDSDSSSSLTTQHYVALALGGVGVVGAVVGSIYGLSAWSASNDVHDRCQAGPNRDLCRDASDVQLSRDAVRDGTRANWAFALSAVALGAGAVLWFTADDDDVPGLEQEPDGPKTQIGVALRGDPTGAQLDLVGHW